MVTELREKARLTSAVQASRAVVVVDTQEKRRAQSSQGKPSETPQVSDSTSASEISNEANTKKQIESSQLQKQSRIISLANRANRINPDLPIIEEKADEMGTGMENIKVLLAAPKSINAISNEPKKLTETKQLYRPVHLIAPAEVTQVPKSVDLQVKKSNIIYRDQETVP